LYRADHIIEQALEDRITKSQNSADIAAMARDKSAAGDMKGDGLQELSEKYAIKSPSGNALTAPTPFNLMFNTHIGPCERAIPGFLRPETAQGIILNFPRLFDFHRGKLPLACAQTGVSYRNEISPKNGLIRCREFMMAEIEHFADPEALDDFTKFELVANLDISLFPASVQDAGGEATVMRLDEAVSQGIVCHKTMGYYIGRTYQFFTEIGIAQDQIRFRQHRNTERAHYARDCWDCEVHCSVGWLECAGLSDRQTFDLTQHARATARPGEEFNPQMFVQVPVRQEKLVVVPDKSAISLRFKDGAREVLAAFDSLPQVEIAAIAANVTEALSIIGHPEKEQEAAAIEALNADAKSRFLELTTIQVAGQQLAFPMYSVRSTTVTVTTRSFIPCVIEPSFGIGRILAVVLEHTFYVKPGNKPDQVKRVLKLCPSLAPFTCAVLPLSVKLIPGVLIDEVRQKLKRAGLSHQADSSDVSIGRRYARADELGVPFAITLDLKTVKDRTVTLRERDSTAQMRLSIEKAVSAISAVVHEIDTWECIKAKYAADDK
jgi:glycyl-tRNA synthetase